MSAPFSFTKELSASQCTAIDRALREHGITLADEKFDWLCGDVEQALTWYINNRNHKSSSRAVALADIRKLQDALKLLDGTAGAILCDATLYTLTEKRIHATGMESDLINALCEQDCTGKGLSPELQKEIFEEDSDPFWSFYRLAVSMLNEACKLTLSDTPPTSIYNEQEDIVTEKIAKGGRPEKSVERVLTRDLAWAFEKVSSRPATDTPSGPFDEFLSACFQVINPNPTHATNRKLIRASLPKYNKSVHVPKPPKTK